MSGLTEVGVVCFGVSGVLGCVIIAYGDFSVLSIAIWDNQ